MKFKPNLALWITAGMLATGFSNHAQAIGLLIPTDQQVGPLGIKYHRAEVQIKDRVAVTHVDQVFVNHTGRDLEATYIFPLPQGASVSEFYLYMNGKRVKGEILEKNRARNIYEGIVRRMKDPGLLEYLGRDLFKCRVYPVPRNGEQRIEIQFEQLMPFEAGMVKYNYPMRTDRASARTMHDFTMSVNIESKTPIKAIYSPTHAIYSRKKDDHHAVAGFEKNAALLDRDFDLFYTVSEKDIGLNLLTYRQPGEPGFFMLMASPKAEFRDQEIMGKRITFVIDTSGSMSGAKMKHAKDALTYCLKRLNSDDIFNVIRFSTDVEAFRKQPVSASKQNIQQAINFTGRMEAAGGTAIDEAMTTALRGHVNRNEPNLVVFMTDGHPTVGETSPARIVKHVAKANRVETKVFVFGVGAEINTHLLDRISAGNGGDSTYVKPNQEIASMLAGFYDKVSHPILNDLRIDLGQIHEYDMLPKRLPDLFKGSQLIAFGRYRNHGHSALTLTGRVGKEEKKFVFEGVFPEASKDNEFIPRLWATRKIGYLLDNIRLGGEKRELVDEVIALSKRYGIVTPYTSYLVTEDTPQVASKTPRPEPRRRPMAPRRTRPDWERGPSGAAQPATDSTLAQPAMTPAKGMDSGGQGRSGYMHRAKKAKVRTQVFAERKAEALKSDSGMDAVSVAGALRDMKEAEAPADEADDASGIRYVAGRAFRYQNGTWVDLKYKPGMQLLKIKYMGKAYFALSERSGKLKNIFTLGERLIVVVGNNLAIEISPQGRDAVGDAELKKFLP